MVKKKSLLRSFGFYTFILFIVASSLFPFIQMLSTSLKYPQDWGNPSLIPQRINWTAYKDILNLTSKQKALPKSIQKVLENPKLSKEQRQAILQKFRSSKHVFPFYKFLGNSFIYSSLAALITLLIAVLGAYSFSRLRYPGRGLVQRGVLFVYMFGGHFISYSFIHTCGSSRFA